MDHIVLSVMLEQLKHIYVPLYVEALHLLFPLRVVMWISKCGAPLLHCAACFDMLNCSEERLAQKPAAVAAGAAAAAFAIFSPTLCSSIDHETTVSQ